MSSRFFFSISGILKSQLNKRCVSKLFLLFCLAGGVLVCASNSLLYLNQSVPPYGVSLNSIADHSTDFPLRKSKIYKIALIHDVGHLYTRREKDGGNYLVTWSHRGQTFSMVSKEDKRDVNTAVF